MRKFVLFSIFLSCSRLLFAWDSYPKNLSIDIEKYVFRIEVTDQNDRLKGQAKISARSLTPLSEMELDLAASDLNGKGMVVKKLSVDGVVASYHHIGQRLKIQFPERTKADTVSIIEIDYEGEPRSGLFIGKNKFGDRVFFADNWPDQGRQWLPSIDHPSDKAAVEFMVVAPSHYSVVANGLKVSESALDGDRKLTHWREDVPIAVKVMVIGVARFDVDESARLNDVAISSWVFPQNRAEGFRDYAMAEKPLTYFQNNIGPYPYKKLANVQSKTRFGGLENANTIFYFENSVTGKADQEGLIAHEIAHQWFGNSATENDWHHVWLSEGFATYFTNLYIEHAMGRERFVCQILADREKVIRYHQKVMRPIVDTSIEDPAKVLSPNTYEKAGWVLHMLRQELGDELFWKGIRLYYQRYAGKNAMSADFKKAMEDASEKDLHAFFQQWLYQAGYPKLNLQWHYDQQKKELRFKLAQVQTQAQFQFPFDVAVMSQDGSIQVHHFQMSQQVNEYKIPSDTIPKSLSLDPYVRLLFEAKIEQR